MKRASFCLLCAGMKRLLIFWLTIGPLAGKISSCDWETYRSGHNELDSKSSCPPGHVGSNPTVSAQQRRRLNGAFCFAF